MMLRECENGLKNVVHQILPNCLVQTCLIVHSYLNLEGMQCSWPLDTFPDAEALENP